MLKLVQKSMSKSNWETKQGSWYYKQRQYLTKLTKTTFKLHPHSSLYLAHPDASFFLSSPVAETVRLLLYFLSFMGLQLHNLWSWFDFILVKVVILCSAEVCPFLCFKCLNLWSWFDLVLVKLALKCLFHF